MTFNTEKIIQQIRLIDEPNATACYNLLMDNLDLLSAAPGSSHNHQAWVGGYLGHVQETMDIVLDLYLSLGMKRHFDFSYSDPLLIMFLHDLEKPWKYAKTLGLDLSTKALRKEFRHAKIAEYGIVLTPEQCNALDYVEGEYEDYSNSHRVMGPLAALCHMADVASARIWFDFPKIDQDS